jgi:hypothetical protein
LNAAHGSAPTTILAESASNSASAFLGYVFLLLTVSYILLAIMLDSRKHGRLAISAAMQTYLLDAVTFATGILIVVSIFHPPIFTALAANYLYATITGLTCVTGPLLSLARKHGRLVD